MIKSNHKISDNKTKNSSELESSVDFDPMNMTFNKSGAKSKTSECPYKDNSKVHDRTSASSKKQNATRIL